MVEQQNGFFNYREKYVKLGLAKKCQIPRVAVVQPLQVGLRPFLLHDDFSWYSYSAHKNM